MDNCRNYIFVSQPVPDPQAQAQQVMDQVQRDIEAALQNVSLKTKS